MKYLIIMTDGNEIAVEERKTLQEAKTAMQTAYASMLGALPGPERTKCYIRDMDAMIQTDNNKYIWRIVAVALN